MNNKKNEIFHVKTYKIRPRGQKTKYISKYLKSFGEKSEIRKFVGKIKKIGGQG